jgi:outer membrane protein OmpA-like peptidoglycan-associated protein
MNRTAIMLGAAGLLGLAACAQTRPPKPPPAAPIARVCADFNFPIYFETGSDRLTAAAQLVLDDAAARVRGCGFGRIDVMGLADADGTARRNLALSRRRAASVGQALAAAGLPRPVFDLEGMGQAGAVTSAGVPEPLRRRAEVVIRAYDPPPAPAR